MTKFTRLADQVRQPLRRVRDEYRTRTAPLRALPSALIIGAQRSGTTSLFNYLVQHPDVLPPLGKEIHYFDIHYPRGPGWYRGRFPFACRMRQGCLTLEASPYYLAHPLAPRRAARLLPGVKLIALLRNPAERALSHYQHAVAEGRETLSFAEAIGRESARLAGEEERLRSDPGYCSYNHRHFSYVYRGRYVEQLHRWAEQFPRSQLLIIQSERLFREPAATMDAVHAFLGLRPHRLAGYEPFYQGSYRRSIPGELRATLVRHFDPYNRDLYRWLGEEFDWA
ncbi:MAG TPA: sulfotransferase [Gemmatimonadales bacterium]|nr:sulfotransferase [Gemmatimonadales bacterium]